MDLTWVTIPRSEKVPRLMTRPPPSILSQWSRIQHFPCELFTAKKMKLTIVFQPRVSVLSAQTPWAVLGLTTVSRPHIRPGSAPLFSFFSLHNLPLFFLPFSLLSSCLHFSFLSHLSLPVFRDCNSTSVLLRVKEHAAFSLKSSWQDTLGPWRLLSIVAHSRL